MSATTTQNSDVGLVAQTYIDNVKSLVDRGLHVEGKASVDLGGDLTRDNLEDLLAKFDEEAVESSIDLAISVFSLVKNEYPSLCGIGPHCIYMLLAVLNGDIHQLGIFGFLRSSEDERGISRGILWLVFVDCLKNVRPCSKASFRLSFRSTY